MSEEEKKANLEALIKDLAGLEQVLSQNRQHLLADLAFRASRLILLQDARIKELENAGDEGSDDNADDDLGAVVEERQHTATE